MVRRIDIKARRLARDLLFGRWIVCSQVRTIPNLDMSSPVSGSRVPLGFRLPDTGEDMGKVGIVLNRDETIQRLHSKWRVAARLVAALCISAAGCWFRGYDALYP